MNSVLEGFSAFSMEKLRVQNLKENLDEVKAQLKSPTKLVVVSKTYPVSDIELCYGLGERDFGENHVTELEEKARELAPKCAGIRFHMIGHLQTNKIKKLLKIPHLYAIHSVDSLHLVEALLKEEKHYTGPEIQLFLQVKTSDEEEKFGFTDQDQLQNGLLLIRKSSKFRVEGLMTMGKIRTDNVKGDAQVCFEKLIAIRNQLDSSLKLSLKLSMGMSGDYEIASQMGANYVRIGSKIFGNRS